VWRERREEERGKGYELRGYHHQKCPPEEGYMNSNVVSYLYRHGKGVTYRIKIKGLTCAPEEEDELGAGRWFLLYLL
jgi:hypothetical protein